MRYVGVSTTESGSLSYLQQVCIDAIRYTTRNRWLKLSTSISLYPSLMIMRYLWCRCVLRHEFHSNNLGVCIGHRNYKYYILFLWNGSCVAFNAYCAFSYWWMSHVVWGASPWFDALTTTPNILYISMWQCCPNPWKIECSSQGTQLDVLVIE